MTERKRVKKSTYTAAKTKLCKMPTVGLLIQCEMDYFTLSAIHCVRKKETKMFFWNIFYKSRAILIKFGT